MTENENEIVSRETEQAETHEINEAIDYTEQLQTINTNLETISGSLGSLSSQLEYNKSLIQQINGQMNYCYNISYFAFVLVMFEVFRFIKGLFKGVNNDN